MTVRLFGTTLDGSDVFAVSLAGGDLSTEILTYGATVRDLRFDGIDHPLVLGLNTIEDYERYAAHFGAIVGRFANRISGGRFSLDGRAYVLERNENGRAHLHGGSAAFSRRTWTLEDHGPDFAVLTLESPDGEAGYPGNLSVSCRYQLTGNGALEILLTAQTDAPTIVNLSTHGYFNLSGEETISGHRLQVVANYYTPTDKDNLPTGVVAPVTRSRFDLRRPALLEIDGGATAFDQNFCLAHDRRQVPDLAARLTGGPLEMTVSTTEPGLQVYTGEGVACPVVGLDGRTYGKRSGVCLEPQLWPDSPNHSAFPCATFRPGDTYRHETHYAFRQVS